MTAGNGAPSIRDRLLSRRTLVQAGGGTALAAVALGDKFFSNPHFTTAQAISPLVARFEDTGTDFLSGDLPAGSGFSQATSAGLTVQQGVSRAQFVSPVYKVDFPITHVGPHWSADLSSGGFFGVELRMSKDGTRWTEWTPVTIEAWEGDAPNAGIFGNLVAAFDADRVQYRVTFDTRNGPATLRRMTLAAINSVNGPVTKVLVPGDGQSVQAGPYIAKPRVITRAGWGADESLRYVNGEEYWGKEYARWRAVVPHHTATTNNYWDSAAVVRSIYYYHAIEQGWRDIGYHALIGNNKEIYMGRAGRYASSFDMDIMAGHVLQCNAGSFGFAFIGDFSYVYIPSGMMRAAQKLAAWVCAERDIDPLGTISFERSDRSVYNGPAIAAHRHMQRPDKYPTACPGDVGYTQFPWFRQYVKAKLDDAPDKTPVPGTSTPTPAPKRYIFTGSGRSANSTVSTLAWDNKTSTFWETTSDTPPSSARIYFDLGSQKHVSKVRWLFQRSWADWCTIEWSNDRITWNFVGDASNPTAKVWYERLINRKIRYIRFVFLNPDKDPKLGGLAEVQLYP